MAPNGCENNSRGFAALPIQISFPLLVKLLLKVITMQLSVRLAQILASMPLSGISVFKPALTSATASTSIDFQLL